MVYIILLSLLIHLYFYKPSNVMACGLFGWSCDDSKELDTKAITILGLFNEERGKTASGVMTNFGQERSVTNGAFSEFIVNSLYYSNVLNDESTYLLCHTRNASPGTDRTINSAQPCIIQDDGLMNYGLIHNGNIRSAGARCLELGLEKSGLSDSYDFHKVLMDAKYRGDVVTELKNYEGKAALVWNNPSDNDTLYVFVGKSLERTHSKEATIERPLFFLTSESGLYFSSTEESLEAAFTEEDLTINPFIPNKLYEIKNGVILKVTDVDRSDKFQEKPYVHANHSTGYPYTHGHSRQAQIPYTGRGGSNHTLNINMLFTVAKPSRLRLSGGMYVDTNNKAISGFYLLDREGLIITKTNAKAGTLFYLAYFNSGYLIKVKEARKMIEKRAHCNTPLLIEGVHNHNLLDQVRTNSAVPVGFPLKNTPLTTGFIYGGLATGSYEFFFTQLTATLKHGALKSIDKDGRYHVVSSRVAKYITLEDIPSVLNLITSLNNSKDKEMIGRLTKALYFLLTSSNTEYKEAVDENTGKLKVTVIEKTKIEKEVEKLTVDEAFAEVAEIGVEIKTATALVEDEIENMLTMMPRLLALVSKDYSLNPSKEVSQADRISAAKKLRGSLTGISSIIKIIKEI